MIPPNLEDLKTRVNQFNALSLPGQPMVMHMGTSYLVNDLWRALNAIVEADEERRFQAHVNADVR